MSKYLVGICYHEPEAWQLFQKGIIEDYESSTAVFIEADSESEAIQWGEKIAEIFHGRMNEDSTLDWSALYNCWIEDIETSSWVHCFSFFQTVRVGELPDLDSMGTIAYEKWLIENNK